MGTDNGAAGNMLRDTVGALTNSFGPYMRVALQHCLTKNYFQPSSGHLRANITLLDDLGGWSVAFVATQKS